MFRVVFILFLATFAFCDECIKCHNIEKFDDKHHNFSCVQCHILPSKKENYTHKDVITHSGSLKNAKIFCIKCHEKQINKYEKSNHYTHKNEINTVFKTFGFDTNYTLQTLPKPKDLTDKKDLITDMLRRKCLKCHSENSQSGERGMYRGKGCMSCHMSYSQDGRYKGSDISLRGKKPYATHHSLGKVQSSSCLSCHNKEYIGAEYLGLFPKDYDRSYRAPVNGKFPPKMYGIDYHHLQEDIHHQKGLSCVSCHKSTQKMPTCQKCHKPKPNEAHAKYHKNLSCSSCHASWQPSHYELNLLLDKTKDYDRWKNLILQEDGYLESFLRKNIGKKRVPKAKMPDWVDHKMEDGIWYSGWRLRRWENLLIGNDKNGVIKIMRPMYQYKISYKDENKSVKFDNLSAQAFLPYSPHTISSHAKSCEACHENPLLKKQTKADGVEGLFSGKFLHSTPLSDTQIQKLHSKKYRKIRAKMLHQFITK